MSARMDPCKCMAESLLCSPETHSIVNWLYPNTKFFLVLKEIKFLKNYCNTGKV